MRFQPTQITSSNPRGCGGDRHLVAERERTPRMGRVRDEGIRDLWDGRHAASARRTARQA